MDSKQRHRFTREFAVGALALSAVVLLALFAGLMGTWRPFSNEIRYHVLYRFAGGVEVGSPVRVSGVKVGRVEAIEFLAPEHSEEASLRVRLTVSRGAAPAVRRDSRFFVNMAGIIGERYVEISPGSAGEPPLEPGSVIRGEDPPRIDQLLSQGYGVFGRVQDFLDANEKTISGFLGQLQELMSETNKLFQRKDRKKFFDLLDNLVAVTGDVRIFTQSLRDEKAQKFFDQLLEIVARTHQVDKEALKKFLQEEGVRARIF